MVRLSINVNKIATLRNARTAQSPAGSRGAPSVLKAAQTCIDAGATGITVHPRPDARHITLHDVEELSAWLEPMRDRVELNVEGDPRDNLMDLVERLRPHQLTLVPVRPGEITSQAGWPAHTPAAPLQRVIARMRAVGVRVSVFVDPLATAIAWAADLGADRVELFTEPFAQAYARDVAEAQQSFAGYVAAAEYAHGLGLGINAGHDLDGDNLRMFGALPHLDEVSIGHAIVSEAVFEGLGAVVRRYLDLLSQTARR